MDLRGASSKAKSIQFLQSRKILSCLISLWQWADPYRTMKVRANADIPQDAINARKFGAEGIGLCRTEHMFFGEDKIRAHAGYDSCG